MKVKVTTLESKAAGDITLSDNVFAITPRSDIVARVVNWQLAKRRAGTHKVKSRGRSSRRPRCTARAPAARHGPLGVQFRGGGVVHGPVVRDHGHLLPKGTPAGSKSALASRQPTAGSLSLTS